MNGEKVKKLSHLASGEIQFDSMSRQGDNRATVYLQFMQLFLGKHALGIFANMPYSSYSSLRY
jgi:hypothetical protein